MPTFMQIPLTTQANPTDAIALYDPNVSPVSRQIDVQNVAVLSASSSGILYGSVPQFVSANESSGSPPASPTMLVNYTSKSGGNNVNQAAGSIVAPSAGEYRIKGSVLLELVSGGSSSSEVYLELWINSVREVVSSYTPPGFSTYFHRMLSFDIYKLLAINDSLTLRVYTEETFTSHTFDAPNCYFEMETFYG